LPPLDQALVKAVACERIAETKQPLSRQSLADVTARARHALGKPSSRRTVWRILETDAIKPWRSKYGSVPREPSCVEKAGPLLALYAGTWQGQPLGPKAHIRSADEKTSLQARIRCHPSLDIYFSILHRKVLTRNDFADLEAIRLRRALYGDLSNQRPTPFQWKFDRTKLTALLAKIEARHMALADAQRPHIEEAA
jgi:hypothetical protein